MKKIKNWLSSSTKNKVIFGCGIVALVAIICAASFFIYKKAIKHEHTVDYKYESLNDGTHKKTSYCTDEDGKKCKGFKSETTTEECEFDKDGVCKYCGYHQYVKVKFVSSIDSTVIKEIKVENGSTLQVDKDFPEAPAVEGYEFVRYDGNFTDLKTDTTITLLYNPIGEENKEEASTNNVTNSNSNSSGKNGANNTSTNNNSSNNNNNSDNNSNDNSSDDSNDNSYEGENGGDPISQEDIDRAHLITQRSENLTPRALIEASNLAFSMHQAITNCTYTIDFGPDYSYATITVTAPNGQVASNTIYPE